MDFLHILWHFQGDRSVGGQLVVSGLDSLETETKKVFLDLWTWTWTCGISRGQISRWSASGQRKGQLGDRDQKSLSRGNFAEGGDLEQSWSVS